MEEFRAAMTKHASSMKQAWDMQTAAVGTLLQDTATYLTGGTQEHPCVVCKKPQCINCQPTLVNIPQEKPVERPSKLPNCTVLEYREVTVCSTCFMALLGWEAPAVDTVLSDEVRKAIKVGDPNTKETQPPAAATTSADSAATTAATTATAAAAATDAGAATTDGAATSTATTGATATSTTTPHSLPSDPTTFNYNLAKWCALMCQAGYEPELAIDVGTPKYARYGALRTACVISGLFNTCCFIAETDKFVAITFRGTCTMANIMHDLTADWVHMPGTLATSSVRVHHGFTLAYNSIRFCVLQKLRAMHKANPDRALLVTGHSMGGALASLAAFDFCLTGVWGGGNAGKTCAIRVVPIASPRVGNAAFVKAYAELLPFSWRVANKGDGVPWVPPHPFHHVPTLVLFDGAGPDDYALKPTGMRTPVLNALPLHTNYLGAVFPSDPMKVHNVHLAGSSGSAETLGRVSKTPLIRIKRGGSSSATAAAAASGGTAAGDGGAGGAGGGAGAS